MKKILVILGLFLSFPLIALATPTSWDFASTVLQPLQSQWTALVKANNFQATSTTQASIFPYASTTAISASGLVSGNCVQAGTGGLLTTIGTPCSSGSGTVTQINTTYPVQGGPITTTGTVSLAFGTTTSNLWAGTQTFTNSPVFSTLVAGTINSTLAGTIYSTSTSTPGVTSPITYSGTLGSFIGGVSGNFACATCLTAAVTSIGPTGQLQTGPAVTLATSSSPFNGLTASTTITGSGNTLTFTNSLAGLLGSGGGGTGFSTYTKGDFLYSSATNVLSKLTIGTGGQILASVNGIPGWVATTTFSSPLSYSSATNAVTCPTCGTSGSIIATTSDIAVPGVAYFTGTAPTVLGSVATGTVSSANTALTVTASRYVLGGALSLTVATTAQNMFTGTPGQILGYSNGGWTGLATTTFSSGLAYSAGNVTNTGVLSLGPTGQSLTGALVLATSSTPFNGLTASTTITCATLTCTFANTLAGILGTGGGGTGTSTAPGYGKVLVGNSAGTGYDYVATSTFGTAGTNYWTSLGNAIYNNTGTAVGINLTTPTSPLEVQATTTGGTVLQVWSNTLTDIFNVKNTGFVGIGTSSPPAQLSVGNGDSSGGLYYNGTGLGIGSSSPSVKFAIGSFAIPYSASANDPIGLITASSSKISGVFMMNPAMGTASDFRFSVYSASTTGATADAGNLNFSAPGPNNNLLLFGQPRPNLFGIFSSGATAARNLAIGTIQANYLLFGTNNTERARFDGAGNFGFGTTSPYEQLSVAGGNLVIGATTAGGTPGNLYLPKLGTATGSFLAVDALGKVIATTTPTGGPTGSGAAGQVTFWSGTSVISGSNNNFWDDTNMRLGIGTSSPLANLTVQGKSNGPVAPFLFLVASSSPSATTTPFYADYGTGHVGFKGTAVGTVSGCGITPTITSDSNDTRGHITTGSLSSNCTYTFKVPYKTAPFCMAIDDSPGTATVGVSAPSVTAVTFNFSVGVTNRELWYFCEE